MVKYTGIYAGLTIISLFLGAAALIAMLADLLLQLAVKIPLLTRLAFMKTAPESESIFSFFYFNLEKLAGADGYFNTGAIKKVSLVFDRTESGVIILNNIGFMP